MKEINQKSLRIFVILISLFVGGFLSCARADIPQDAQYAAENSRKTTLLKFLAEAAEARGDYLTCAALAKEADRIASRTDLLKQQVIAEFNQLTPAQQNQVRTHRDNVIADATVTRQQADAIQGCYNAVLIFILFILILFVWLFWRAFGPFFTSKKG
jgi:hypothetical protein